MLSFGVVKRMMALIAPAVLLSLGLFNSPAHAQADDPLTLIEQVISLSREGKFTEAIEIQKRVMVAIEKMAGKKHPLYLMQIASLGDLHGMKGDNPEAERFHSQALALREQILGREHADVASSLAALANAYINLARYDEAEAALGRALAIRRKVLPESSPDYGFTYVNLGRLYTYRSRFAEAEHAFQQARDLLTRHLPPDHPYLPVVVNNLAEAHRALGHFAEAERLLREALETGERIHGRDNVFTSPMINNLAQLYRQQARYDEAEALMRRELAITEKALGPENPTMGVSLTNLGTLLTARGRPRDAVPLLKRALAISEKIYGPDHPDVAATLNNLANATGELDMPEETERLLRRSLAIRERFSGGNDLSGALGLNNLASFLQSAKRYAEAETVARRALAVRVQNQAADHPEVALSIGNLATILDNVGKHAEARGLHQRSLEIREASLGPNHPEFATGLNNLGANRLDEHDWQAAYDNFKRSNNIWIARRAAVTLAAGAGPISDQDRELKRNANSFLGLIWAGFELQRTANAQRQRTLSDEGFESMQWGSLSSAAGAVAKMSARIAAGAGALGALVREQQDLTSGLEALDKSLIVAISSPPTARSKSAEADLRKRADAVGSRLKELAAELSSKFPQFAAVANPEPRSIAEVRKALQPQEALYAIAPTRGGSFAWVITQDAERWVRIDRTDKELEDDVTALRCGLDAATWIGPNSRCPALTGRSYGEDDFAAGKLPPFDLDRSHKLYQALFGQVEDLIKDRHLIIVPNGALSTLPFQVLVTQKPSPGSSEADRHRQTAWLALRMPITVLPAIGSLDALRNYAKASAASQPYLGFGNPLLTGPDQRYAPLAALARSRQVCAEPSATKNAAVARLRGAAGRVATSGGFADLAFLRSQPPLPETADELCEVANDLRAGVTAVQLGRNAAEAKVKRLNDEGVLARYRVLHFATHAAMVGEVVGASEPGLILTPPENATGVDDGYLSASEIALLRLDADLVILSACNTAAGGAEGSEALSGLARSFFYAGARAMLVSHWAVNSAATVKLVTVALAAMAADAKIGPAEALRGSMSALIARGGDAEVHPANWAPFVVVGGAARQP